MKFEFSLQPVLNVREHEEKIEKQKLAEKQSKKKRLARHKEKLQEKLNNLLDEADEQEFKNLHDFRRHRRYINEVHKKVEKINSSLRVVEDALDQQREKLAAVHKKRHIMEKVKEEEREAFLEKMSRQQRKIMDEVATQTFSQ